MPIKIKIFAVCLITVFVIVFIPKGQAQAGLLPNCDKTCYKVTEIDPAGDEEPGTIIGECLEDASKYIDDPSYVVEINTDKENACGFNDFVQLLINLTSWGLGLMAALALFFFIWGGFNLLISAGRAEKIQEAKNILKGTFIGLILVLVAWNLVGFYVLAFAGSQYVFPNYPEFMKKWWTGQDCRKTYAESCDINNLHRGCGDGAATQGNVTKLQKKLLALSCNCGSSGADGCFGPQTQKCLMSFQEANGLVPGGIAGPETWDVLNNDPKFCDKWMNDYIEKALKDTDFILRGGNTGTTNGCCVPTTGGFSCIDTAQAICPSGQVTESGEEIYSFTYQAKPCDQITDCIWGCCYKENPMSPLLTCWRENYKFCGDEAGEKYRTGWCADIPDLRCE